MNSQTSYHPNTQIEMVIEGKWSEVNWRWMERRVKKHFTLMWFFFVFLKRIDSFHKSRKLNFSSWLFHSKSTHLSTPPYFYTLSHVFFLYQYWIDNIELLTEKWNFCLKLFSTPRMHFGGFKDNLLQRKDFFIILFNNSIQTKWFLWTRKKIKNKYKIVLEYLVLCPSDHQPFEILVFNILSKNQLG